MAIKAMFKALIRLALISVVAIIGTVTLFAFLRFLGMSQGYSAMEHPLTSFSQWVILKNGFSPKEKNKNWAYLKHLEITGSSKSTFSKINKDNFFWLYINTNKQTDLDALIKYIQDHNLEENVVIHGPFKKSIEYVQKQQPRLLFVANPLVLNQLTIMDALFLETFASMRFDVVFVSTKIAKAQLKRKLLKEFSRRQIRLVLDSTDPSDPWFVKNKDLITGVMTDRPDILTHLSTLQK